jgi:hypothetical protein
MSEREPTDEAAIWRSHLTPGEKIVLSGAESRAMLAADHRQRRTAWFWLGLICAVLAIAATLSFLAAAFNSSPEPNLANNLAGPLYLAFGLSLGVASVFFVIRAGSPPPEPGRFAATNLRLVTIDASGRVTAQMAGADIASVQLVDRIDTASVIVTGHERNENTPLFSVHNIENAAALKAAIESTFPEARP